MSDHTDQTDMSDHSYTRSITTGAVWSRPSAHPLLPPSATDGRGLLGHAHPEHSGRHHADARGAASSLHTRRRGSFFLTDVKRETLADRDA
jgi:hypothetical protein